MNEEALCSLQLPSIRTEPSLWWVLIKLNFNGLSFQAKQRFLERLRFVLVAEKDRVSASLQLIDHLVFYVVESALER